MRLLLLLACLPLFAQQPDTQLIARQAIAAEIRQFAELGEFTTMLALVSAGLGVGLLPANAGRALPANVISRPLELGDYRATTGLAWVGLESAVKVNVFNLISSLFGADS